MKIVPPKKLEKNHNVSEESDSSLVVRYIWFFLFLILLLYAIFWFFSFIIIQFVSIEDEKKFFWFDGVEYLWEEIILPEDLKERYKDIPYTLSLIDMGEEANAFAALGGNIYLTKAFLEQVDYYEELDFVIGHEIAHVEHRDVLRNIISSVPLIVLLSIFWWEYGWTFFNAVVSNTHSKMHETRADYYALDFVHTRNNHVGCTLDFFEKWNTIEGNLMEVFSTHPVTELRIQRAKKYIETQGYIEKACTAYNL